LEGLPNEPVENSDMDTSIDLSMIQEPTNLDLVEHDKFLLGKSYFDVKEFDRAAYFLESCKSPKCRFLKIYSKYLVSKKIIILKNNSNAFMLINFNLLGRRKA
jgi:anaphase-promoting complex subunit 8